MKFTVQSIDSHKPPDFYLRYIYILPSVKHGGGGVMAWAHMAASGTGPLIITDDLMYDDSSIMNLEGYKIILPTNIQENATRFIGKCFILH